MVDSTVKSAGVLAVLGVMAASYLSGNPDKAKELMALADSWMGRAPTLAAGPKPEPLFPTAPPPQRRIAMAPQAAPGDEDPAPQGVAPKAAAPKPASYSQSTGFGDIVLLADSGGQFHSDVTLDGVAFPMIVDTGATYVSISYDDAVRAYHVPLPAEFKYTAHTANGDTKVAMVILKEVRMQTLTVRDVPALVSSPGVQTPPLLGMSFLKKLKMTAEGGRLVLHQ